MIEHMVSIVMFAPNPPSNALNKRANHKRHLTHFNRLRDNFALQPKQSNGMNP